MNLINGLVSHKDIDQELLDDVKCDIISTLSGESLDVYRVVDACDNLSKNLTLESFGEYIEQLDISNEIANMYFSQIKELFNKQNLLYRLHRELGKNLLNRYEEIDNKVCEQVQPLGVLLHIPAGNADALPVYTVIEGLLTGNINILKLPSKIDNGLTINILQMLIKEYDILKKYIYVFDYSSKDIFTMKNLINLAHGVVVWGGVEAVSALRMIVPPEIKLIEWGHKISFAYFTKGGVNEQNLIKVAKNIAVTNQLLCSSCQGIYLDTDNIKDVYDFCEKFLCAMDQVSKQYKLKINIGIQAQITLSKLTQKYSIEDIQTKVFATNNVSITAYNDSKLIDCIKYRNCWAKPLAREKIIQTLYPYKNFLQTISLNCMDSEREYLNNLFIKAGVTRISSNNDMSHAYLSEPHDGELSLRRYVKVVSFY